MKIGTQYLKNKRKWTAFTTLNGLDIYEIGETEKEAIENLTDIIAKSKFLTEGLKIPK